MSMQLAPSRDLGLQHVLQNGLAIVRSEPIERERDQVLKSLIDIFSEADRGFDTLKASTLSLMGVEQPTLDRCTVFNDYLKGDAPAILSGATKTLEDLREGKLQDLLRLTQLDNVLAALLDALGQDRALSPLVAPREFSYL